MPEPIRALIVDDDFLARKRVRNLLAADPEVRIMGECASGREAIASIEEERPDLLFLDVQMPDVDGFGVVEAIGADRMPAVIFVSGHVDFALRAFDAYALDYLLKPFEDERFARALERAKKQARARAPEPDLRMDALIGYLQQPARPTYPEVMAIKSGGQFRLLRAEEIDWIAAEENYVAVHAGKARLLINRTLTELETKVLDPTRFIRVNRSVIVNLARIVGVEPLFHGEFDIVLADGKRLVCTRRYRHKLQDRVYFAS